MGMLTSSQCIALTCKPILLTTIDIVYCYVYDTFYVVECKTFINYRQYSLQPGCWTIMCAHSRSYEYFAESVNNGKHFIAAQCNSLSSLRNGRCTKRFVEMGLNTPHSVRGNFYLETNSKAPYGRSFKPYDSLMQHGQLVLLE